MHGIQKILTFSFRAVITKDSGTQQKNMNINGSWLINRKDFKIIWNKLLDHGGVLVSDYFTVNWEIKVRL